MQHLSIGVYTDVKRVIQSCTAGNDGYIYTSVAPHEHGVEITTTSIHYACETKWQIDDMPISMQLSNAIAVFVNMNWGKRTGMDCYGFVNLVGQKLLHPNTDIDLHWKRDLIEPSQVTAGDCLAFANFCGHHVHNAVAVTDTILLSVIGSNGDLEFSTFDGLKHPYQIAKTYRLQ